MSGGLVILRLVVGLLFIGHGTQKLFGWFGGGGLEGTSASLTSLGYPSGRAYAASAGLGEAGGGSLLVLGFLTPIGVAMIIGVMVNAIGSVHLRRGVWNTQGGFEYPLVMIASSLTLAFEGPGPVSIDRLLGWTDWGWPWALGALASGVMAGAGILASRRPKTVAKHRLRSHRLRPAA